MSDLILDTTSATFDADVLQGTLPVLLDFWAPWCGPCVALAPQLEMLATQYAGKLRVIKLNVDDHPDVSQRFAVRGIPALLMFRDGEIVHRVAGPSQSRLRVLVEDLVGTGIVEPVDEAAVSEAVMQPIISFDGNAEIKQAALLRLQAHAMAADVRLSDAIAGAKGEFAQALGLPAALANVFDLLRQNARRWQDEARYLRPAVALFEAIPVGVDLRGLPVVVAYWVLHDPQWGIGRHLKSAEAVALFGKLRALHDEERAGQSVSRASWHAMAREIVTQVDGSRSPQAADNNDRGASGPVDILAGLFETVGVPLAELNLARALNGALYMAPHDEVAFSGWSNEDHVQFGNFKLKHLKEGQDVCGPQPAEPAAREAWVQALNDRIEAAMQTARSDDPDFWGRLDAFHLHERAIAAQCCEALAGFVASKLALAPDAQHIS
jgi:thioredoxin